MERQAPITVSIVSHSHGSLLPPLLDDLAACPEVGRIILTRNVPEPSFVRTQSDALSVVENQRPQGFGVNHNAAFARTTTPYFAILNPDVRLTGNPFPGLLHCMAEGDAALCAPAVVDPAGRLEDSAREFPGPADLLLKLFGLYDGRLRYAIGDASLPAPWVAGMFMLVRREDFAGQAGFDEKFFLYYEDVDLCARFWKSGRPVMLCPKVHVIHDARRASRRDIRHVRWHAASMARYFRKHWRYAMSRKIV